MELQIDDLDGGVTHVLLRGRMDTKGAAEIDTRFNTVVGQRRAVLVDMTQVDFLASMGLRSLVTGAKTVKARGGKLAVLAIEGPVTATIAASGLGVLIPTFDDHDAALAAVSGA